MGRSIILILVRGRISSEKTRVFISSDLLVSLTATIILTLSLFWCLPASAQDPLNRVGAPTFSTSLPVELGSLDVSNGDLTQAIMLGSLPERGSQQFTGSLIYDSRIWQIVNSTWQPTNISASQGGWRYISTGFAGTVGYSTTTWKCVDNLNQIKVLITQYQNFVWTAPDGTQHTFNVSTTHDPSAGGGYFGCFGDFPTGSGWATDSTGFAMYVTNYTSATVYAPDGTQVYPSIKDSNGNFFSFDASGNVIDTLGRTPVRVTSSCNGNASLTCYDVLNSQGGTSRYTVTTASISVSTAFGQTGVTEYSGSMTVIQSIQQPDLTSYQFSYDSGTTAGHYGLITGVTLTTGGQIAYGYTTFQDSFGNRNRWVTSRTSAGGTWSYTPAVMTTCASGTVGCQQNVTVAKPSGDNLVYIFTLNNGAWASQILFYTGAISSSNLTATLNRTWNFSNPCSPTPCTGNSNIQKMNETLTFLLPSGSNISKTMQYNYAAISNLVLTSIKEWKFYSGTLPSAPDRETDMTYLVNYSQNILNRPATTIAKDSSGNVVARTNYSYDSGTLLTVSGATNHDDLNFGPGNTARGNLTQTQSLVSGTSSYVSASKAYDTTGQVVSFTDSVGNQTTYSYANSFFNDIGDGPSNPPQSATHAATNAYPTTVTRPGLPSSTVGYYWGSGQQASYTDANGQTWYWHYFDPSSRMTSTVQPNGGWTSTAYASSEMQLDAYTGITGTFGFSGCTGCRHDQKLLDSMGRLSNQVLVSDPEGATTVVTNYDSNNRVAGVSNPYRTTSDPTYGSETVTYDGLDREIRNTHPDSAYSQVFYGRAVGGSGLGGVISQLCSSATYGVGYPILSIDELGKKRETWSDGLGRTIEVDEPDPNGSLSNSPTCYKYDLLNEPLQVVHGAMTRTYTYDMLSRMTSATIPETGTGSSSHTTNYYYTTSSGSLCSGNTRAACRVTDPRGITATYAYDALDRLRSVAYSDGTFGLMYGYDGLALSGCSTTPPVLTITNPKGRRTSMCDSSGAASFSYDSVGNVLTEARTILGITKSISYSYNLDGSLATMTYPSGKQVTYTVSNAQRMTSAKDLASNIQFAIIASYAPPGGLQGMITGQINGGFGGNTESHTYNNRLEYTSTKAVSSAGTPLNLSIGYNIAGGNNGSISNLTNNADNGRTQNISYDPLNRVLTASSQATVGVDCWGQNFGPDGTVGDDAVANLTAINSGTQSPQPCPFGRLSVTVDGNNHLNSSTSFAYDAGGNMTQDGSGLSYTFDAENHLTLASGMSGGPYCYVYDGNGLRVAKKSNAATCAGGTVARIYWRSISGDTIAETDSSGSTTNSAYTEYVFFGGRRIASRNGVGSVFYFYADQLGTTRTITDAQGNLCYDGDFSPYGQEISHSERLQTSACPTNYKFTGFERDPETGLDYAFTRYYSSALGRFLSADPTDGDISSPQSLNKYAYVVNDPVDGNDPDGLRCYIVVFGILTNRGAYNAQVPGSAANYPYDGKGLVGSIGSVFSQSLFGPNAATKGLSDLVQKYSNEPGGVDIVAFSGGAQTVSTGIQSGLVPSTNVDSITYLSPGLGPFGSLSHVGDTKSFRGSGLKDFAATFFSRLSGASMAQTGAHGHNFTDEFQSKNVKKRLAALENGKPKACGTANQDGNNFGEIILVPMYGWYPSYGADGEYLGQEFGFLGYLAEITGWGPTVNIKH